MKLSKEEIERYDRHIKLSEVGILGQEKLKSAKVLVVGAGGLGCPVLQYLAAAGVGKIGVVDGDQVDVSNLQRQILYRVNDVGENKAQVAAKILNQLNPSVDIQVYPFFLNSKNALDMIFEYDILVDGTDNFSTRYLINDAAVLSNKPFVYGAIHKFEGQVSVFNYKDGPTYRCLFPDAPGVDALPNCSDIGVLGVLPGLIGSFQANEVLKMILGIGQVLSGKLLMLNALSNQQTIMEVVRQQQLVDTVLNKRSEFSSTDYEMLCASNENSVTEMNIVEFNQTLSENNSAVLDVRQLWEEPRVDTGNVFEIPLNELATRFHELPTDKPIVVCCQHGVRSLAAIDFLASKNFKELINLTNGLVEYSNHEYT